MPKEKPSALKKEHHGGFTLVELLIVIVILGVLAAIVVFAVGTTSQNAVAASCSADAKSVETALNAYDAQMAVYPASVGALATTASVPNGGGWVGPWLRATPGTLRYQILIDTSGNLYAAPPGASVGGTYSVPDSGTTAVVAAGGTFDFDSDPGICGVYS